MTYRQPRLRHVSRHVSKRQVQAVTAFMSLGTDTPVEMPAYKPVVKRGKQKESAFDKTIGQWGASKGGELHKNRRGVVQLPGGGMFPYGWGPNGTLDRVGWLPVRITPAMVGLVLPIHAEIEAKTSTGTLQDNQQKRIEFLCDHHAIAGVAYGELTIDDCERILAAWGKRHG